MKSPNDKIKDALGIKDNEQDEETTEASSKETSEEEKTSEEEEEEFDEEEEEESTPPPKPQQPAPRGPGRPPKVANTSPEEKPTQPKSAPSHTPKQPLPQQPPQRPQQFPITMPQPVDPYIWYTQNNVQVNPVDVIITHKKGNGIVGVFIDAASAPEIRGISPAFPNGRSALNCSMYLNEQILEKFAMALSKETLERLAAAKK